MQSQAGQQDTVDRFVEDVSFWIDQDKFYPGFTAIRPVTSVGSKIYLAVDTARYVETVVEGQVPQFNDAASFYLVSVTSPSK